MMATIENMPGGFNELQYAIYMQYLKRDAN
jgi:hypothetical protein